jgi:hypothetical protein
MLAFGAPISTGNLNAYQGELPRGLRASSLERHRLMRWRIRGVPSSEPAA